MLGDRSDNNGYWLGDIAPDSLITEIGGAISQEIYTTDGW